MLTVIPGFPSNVSMPVDLPDIAELLLQPAFQSASPETYRRYGTEFQRNLLDQVPLKNDKKYVIVRSGVWLLAPGTRSHVSGEGDWHIDSAGYSDNDVEHLLPAQRVFILSSPCTALTEFASEEFRAERPASETRQQFIRWLYRDGHTAKIIPKAIEPGRIYEFSNHLHRAVDPKRLEFRFFLRVRETDEPTPMASRPLKRLEIRSAGSTDRWTNVEYTDQGVLLHWPTSSAAELRWLGRL